MRSVRLTTYQPYLLVFFPSPIWTPLDNKGGGGTHGSGKSGKRLFFGRKIFLGAFGAETPQITREKTHRGEKPIGGKKPNK